VARIAVCQTLCIDSDLEGNLRRIAYATEQASVQKAKLACFSETALLGWVNPQAHKLAHPIPGPMFGRVAGLARKYKIMIAIGMAEKDGDKLYDSAVLIDTDGSLLLKHRKINTLRKLMKPPYARGKMKDITAVDTSIGRIGMLICADTFKEELVKTAGEKSPDLLIVPYGWAAKNEDWPKHCKALKKTVAQTARWARCPVIGTDMVGMITNGPWTGYTYGGASVVAGAPGKAIAVLREQDTDLQVVKLPVGHRK
jgi:predicted amidohydrolase